MTRQLKTLKTVAIKELRDFIRDPRSLILSFLLPLLLFPLLFWVLNDKQKSLDPVNTHFKLAAEWGITESPFLRSEGVTITYLDQEWEGDWRDYFQGIIILTPHTEEPIFLYDNTDSQSMAAYHYLRQLNTPVPPTDQDMTPLEELREFGKPLYPPQEAAGKVFLGMILPFIFFIFSITCPLPSSADLSAGEKERGSLEPLLSTAAPRRGILLGKLTAASLIGVCSVGAYLLGIYLSYTIMPEIMGEIPMTFPLRGPQVLLLTLLLLIMSSLFSGIELCAGFVTRSVREAQLLAMPLLSVGMGAVYISQNLDISHREWYYLHIPLVNLGVVIKEVALDRIIFSDVFISLLWSLIYLVIIVIVAVNMFQRESSFMKSSQSVFYLPKLRSKGIVIIKEQE